MTQKPATISVEKWDALSHQEQTDWLEKNANTPAGAECPSCGQLAKIYTRKLNKQMTRVLIAMYRQHGQDWCRFTELGVPARADEAKLAYWGLIESEEGIRDDGSNRVGVWRVTDKGVDFISKLRKVPRYAVTYDGALLRLEGDPIGVDEATGFHYDQMMRGE